MKLGRSREKLEFYAIHRSEFNSSNKIERPTATFISETRSPCFLSINQHRRQLPVITTLCGRKFSQSEVITNKVNAEYASGETNTTLSFRIGYNCVDPFFVCDSHAKVFLIAIGFDEIHDYLQGNESEIMSVFVGN